MLRGVIFTYFLPALASERRDGVEKYRFYYTSSCSREPSRQLSQRRGPRCAVTREARDKSATWDSISITAPPTSCHNDAQVQGGDKPGSATPGGDDRALLVGAGVGVGEGEREREGER